MKLALVHDWLTGMRGGERVLEELCEIFPEAPVYTLFHQPGSVSRRIESMAIRASFLNRIPGARRHYRNLLPFLPLAISTFNLREFDLIVSVSHAAAKGIRKPLGALHICYCLTPMRYLWDMQSDYFQYADPLHIKRTALQAVTRPLRWWDRATARAVDHFIADSRHVQDRISRYYGRNAALIYPPVDTEYFTPSSRENGAGFYLVVSALVPYKRVDIAVDAFNALGYPLRVAGSGPDLDKLKRRAAGNIRFEGFVTNEDLRGLYRRCRAVIVTAREDFGLVALEAQACGRPPLAYGRGGSLESITDGETGILFGRQTTEALIEGVRRLENTRFSPEKLRENAARFSREGFRRALVREIQDRFDDHVRRRRPAGTGKTESGIPAAGRHSSIRGLRGAAKRGIDVALSLLGLSLLGLPLILTALVIRRGSPGPGLFCQPRVGQGGREFVMIKLRTMYRDAELRRGATWAVRDDPRCTPFGSVLRRYGIDELPQLWNVLRGDMSLVGPRPERPEFRAVFEAAFPDFKRRVEVRAGITGLAQIRGWRGDTSIEQRIKSDLQYIENWTLWKDLLILFRTPLFLMRQAAQPDTTREQTLTFGSLRRNVDRGGSTRPRDPVHPAV